MLNSALLNIYPQEEFFWQTSPDEQNFEYALARIRFVRTQKRTN
ncbi:hypothetical protein NIES4101_87840 [Calothrix sp. NIES-4101]|nr:hypothetical protein NIES4101_87840 [Calothrix sp. NIES-4101]